MKRFTEEQVLEGEQICIEESINQVDEWIERTKGRLVHAGSKLVREDGSLDWSIDYEDLTDEEHTLTSLMMIRDTLGYGLKRVEEDLLPSGKNNIVPVPDAD